MQQRSILRYNSGQTESRLASFPELSMNPPSQPALNMNPVISWQAFRGVAARNMQR